MGIPARALNVDTGFFPECVASAGVACTDLFIPSFDGTALDATFYIPSSAAPSSRVPAILMTHGYPGWHRGTGDFALQQALAAEGYVVLAYTSRGLGRSEGTIQLNSPDFEVKDASHLITWLATADNTGNVVQIDGPVSRRDPRIGMAGGSYAGGIQLLTAAYDTRLDAITPQITWNDLRYSLFPNGVIKRSWIDLLYAAGKYSGYLGPVGTFPPPVISTEGVPTDQDIQVLLSYSTNDDVETPVPYSDGTQSSLEYLERRSPVFNDVIDNITAPTLLIQGQRDTLFTVSEAIANRAAIADNGSGVPTKLVVFSGGHGYSDLPGERAAINSRIFDWFDRYLRGNTSVDTGDPIEVWRPWVSGSNFGGLASLPSATTDAGISPTSAVILNLVAPTSHTETSNFQENTNSPAFDAPVTSVSLAGSAVGSGSTLTIAGIPILRFTIDATASEAIVFAKLWDLDTATGVRTPIHRLVTPVRVRGDKGDFCSDSLAAAASTSLVADVRVCLPLQAVVWQLGEGHSLVLTLATSDTSFYGSRQASVYQLTNISLTLPTTTGL